MWKIIIYNVVCIVFCFVVVPETIGGEFAEKNALALVKLRQLNQLNKKASVTSEKSSNGSLQILNLKKKIAEGGVVIRLSDGNYEDVTQEAFGGQDIGSQEQRLLAELNYWEQNYGVRLNKKETLHTDCSCCDILRQEASVRINEIKRKIDREGVDITWGDDDIYQVNSVERRDLLKRLTELYEKYGWNVVHFISPSPDVGKVIDSIHETKAKLAEKGAIPVRILWKWKDERNFAVKIPDISWENKLLLADLNLWDRSYGRLSVPKELEDRMRVSYRGRHSGYLKRKNLEDMGLVVEMDNDLRIWTIVRREKVPLEGTANGVRERGRIKW